MRKSAAVFSALLAFGVLACDRTPAMPKSIEEATFAPALGIDLKAFTKTPSGLYFRDVSVGDGPVAAPRSSVWVFYTGWFPNGKKFDADVAGQDPFRFTVAAGQVIPGWDEGIVGMKVHGVRELIVPANLGYGPQGSPPTIPPNAILVFRVELVDAK